MAASISHGWLVYPVADVVVLLCSQTYSRLCLLLNPVQPPGPKCRHRHRLQNTLHSTRSAHCVEKLLPLQLALSLSTCSTGSSRWRFLPLEVLLTVIGDRFTSKIAEREVRRMHPHKKHPCAFRAEPTHTNPAQREHEKNLKTNAQKLQIL